MLPRDGSPDPAPLALYGKFAMYREALAAPSSSEASQAETSECFAVLQVHVAAVKANDTAKASDTAVQLFREGRLDDAIAELRCGLSGHPHYVTGYGNLGFRYLRKGRLEPAIECLLRALELDPKHKDAAHHLFDIRRILIDELVLIGLMDGFLSTQLEAEAFDEHNRHKCVRDIGFLIAQIGQKRIFRAGDSVLDHDLLLRIVITEVQKRMDDCGSLATLPFA